MRTWIAVLAVIGLCMSTACTKKPTEVECQQAVTHLSDILQKEATEKMKQMQAQMGVPASVDPGKGMAEAMKNMQGSETWAFVRNAHIAACQSHPQKLAFCVSNASTVDELVNSCGMKASPGPRGGVTLSWPD